jgi:flagellar FliJ protein
MSARFPLQPVMDIAREGADAATVQLGQAMQRAMDADKQLKTLLEYREEYHSRFMSTVTTGIDPAAWHNFHLFMQKLDAGIEQARAHADAAREAARRAQANWQEQQRKLKAYNVLAERHDKAQQLSTAKREQRETDEHAANKFIRATAGQQTR